jgi:ATP-dependent protease Clp ATPase subunit
VENVISPLLFDLPEKKKGSKVKITKKFVTDATLKNSKAA